MTEHLNETGIFAGTNRVISKNLSSVERIDRWFIAPLMKMKGDDGFIALILCLSLLEKILRYRTDTQGNSKATFSEGSKLLKALGKYLELNENSASDFWMIFRNSLLHGSMMKPSIPYQLHSKPQQKPVTLAPDGTFRINVWQLRNKIIDDLETIGTKLWRGKEYPLPEIFSKQ